MLSKITKYSNRNRMNSLSIGLVGKFITVVSTFIGQAVDAQVIV